MLVQDVIALVQIRSQHISLAEDDDTVIRFINLAMAELYRRFNLSVKSETVVVNMDRALYELENPDVQLILALYDHMGRELKQSDVIDSHEADVKLVNYRSFLLNHRFNGHVYVIYKASPVMIRDVADNLKLPDCMISPMLTYISYLTNDTINRDNKNEASMFLQLFDKQCQELENQGYKVQLSTESYAVQAKGFV